jgi:Suppressor of fused protein (SUFU)
MDEERSPGGSEIKRYEARDRELEPAHGDPDLIEGLTDHVERHLGPEPHVFHELVSDIVHVDVLRAAPTDELPFNTLMTCGMSERPMAAPDDFPEGRYAEVMLRLPPDWPLDDEAFKDESAYWPVRLLKTLARVPHEYDTWLWYGHTIPNADPPEPYAPNTQLCGAFLLTPVLGPDGFDRADVAGRQINVLAVVPVHADEMEMKLEKGAEELAEQLDRAKVSEVVEPGRPSVARQRRRLFRR